MATAAARAEPDRSGALALTHAKEWHDAAEAWQALVRSTKGGFEALYRLAEAQFFLHRHVEAIATAHQAQLASPSDPRPLYIIARARTNARQFAEAAECWVALAEAAPTDYEVWTRLGQCHAQLGRSLPAAVALGRAIGLQPLGAIALKQARELFARTATLAQGELLSQMQGATTEAGAFALLRDLLSAGSLNEAARQALASLLKNSLAKAASSAAANAGEWSRICRELGRTAVEFSLWEIAAEIWTHLKAKLPGDEEALLQLARAVEAMGRHDDALQAVDSILSRSPRNEEALRAQIAFLSARGTVLQAAERAAQLLDADLFAGLAWLTGLPEPWVPILCAGALLAIGSRDAQPELVRQRRIWAMRCFVAGLEHEMAGAWLGALIAYQATDQVSGGNPDAQNGMIRMQDRIAAQAGTSIGIAGAEVLGVVAAADKAFRPIAARLVEIWGAAGRSELAASLLARKSDLEAVPGILPPTTSEAHAGVGEKDGGRRDKRASAKKRRPSVSRAKPTS